MKRLYKFLRPYLKWTLLAPLFMIVEVGMDTLSPLLMSQIVNTIDAGGQSSDIVKMLAAMIGVALLGVVGGAGCVYYSSKAGYAFARDMRSELYKKIQSFSFANIDKFKTGTLVTRVTNDVNQVQNAFQSIIRMLVRSPFLCIMGVIMVFSLNAGLAVVLAVAIPILAVIVWLLMKKAFPMFKQMQEKVDKVNVVMQENLAGVRVIKAFGRSDYEVDRFKDANDQLTDTGKKAMKLMAMSFPLVTLVLNMTMIAVYWMGGNLVLGGAIETGTIMAFASYITQILMSFIMSSFMLLFVSRAKVSVDRINEVLDTKVDIVGAADSNITVNEGRVEFNDVSFSYPGQAGEPVLQNISFTARPGMTVAVMGSTGSGKTSLISLIPRLYDASAGEVLVDGHNVKEYMLDNLRRGIGVVLQESILFSGTIEENLKWGDPDASEELVTRSAGIAQADGFIRETTDGYDTMLGQRGVNLSGGQKQRLSIARALIKQPKILIMDDSTSAVDLNTEAEIQRMLRENMQEMTVFIIAQRVSSVVDADSIIIMDDGRIADMGTHAELIERCRIYRELVVSQLGKEAV